MSGGWESVIGLEVHAQLRTRTKAFCGCSANFGDPPNTNVCPVCAGLPGCLPVPNGEMVRLAVRFGLATGCAVRPESRFARKNYFYPDLPKGYQISQFEDPICEHGILRVDVEGGGTKPIRVTRAHLEEDAGKNTHEAGAGARTLLDFNRCGVPLLEIVSAPDLREPDEAVAYLKELRRILVYLDVCDGNMEEGSFRCDANVSVRPRGETALGTRAEVKNLNSFRSVQRALAYEIERQVATIEAGRAIVLETRLWDDGAGRTEPMRGKEEAHDYRYFPEPDIPPLAVSDAFVEEVRGELPELPRAKRARFVADHGLSEYDAEVLTDRRDLADYFEEVVRACGQAKLAANWVMVELLGALGRTGRHIEDNPIPAGALGRLLRAIDAGAISGKMGKDVLQEMIDTGAAPEEVIARTGTQISDTDEVGRHVDAVLAAHPAQVADYRAGREKLMGFFVGHVMRATKGKANPQVVNDLLKERLKAS